MSEKFQATVAGPGFRIGIWQYCTCEFNFNGPVKKFGISHHNGFIVANYLTPDPRRFFPR